MSSLDPPFYIRKHKGPYPGWQYSCKPPYGGNLTASNLRDLKRHLWRQYGIKASRIVVLDK